MKKLTVEEEIEELKDTIEFTHEILNIITNVSLRFLDKKLISNHFKISINEKCRALKREIIFCETNLWNRLLVLTAGKVLTPEEPSINIYMKPKRRKRRGKK